MRNSHLGCLRHQNASKLNAHWQTDWAIEDQAKHLNLTDRPYDEWAFNPLDFTADWLSHWRYTCLLCTYMPAVVNFDAMLWHRQTIFEWKGDKLFSPAECKIDPKDSDTKSSQKKLTLDSPSLWSANIQLTRPYYRLALHKNVERHTADTLFHGLTLNNG